MTSARATVYRNPHDDDEFRRQVEAALEDVDSPQRLQERLRTRYPLALVRARELSAEAASVWYAYRDGHWVPAGTVEGPRGSSTG